MIWSGSKLSGGSFWLLPWLSLLVAASLIACEGTTRYVVKNIPVIGPIAEHFAGNWIDSQEQKILGIGTKSDSTALVKQYFSDKLQFVATDAQVVGDSLLMEFTRNNVGRVYAKLTRKGKLEIAYPDMTVTMELERSE